MRRKQHSEHVLAFTSGKLFRLVYATLQQTFQAMMDGIFHDMLDEGVVVYLDDILIYAENMTDHEGLVKEVLKRLDKAGLSMNTKKSHRAFLVAGTRILHRHRGTSDLAREGRLGSVLQGTENTADINNGERRTL